MSYRAVKLVIVFVVVLLLAVVSGGVLYRISTGILKSRIEKAMGENVKAGRVNIRWNRVTVSDLVFTRDGKVVGKVDKVDLTPQFLGFLKRHVAVDEIEVTRAYFRIETDKQGHLLMPISPPQERAESPGKKARPMPVEVKKVVFTEGAVEFEDRTKPGAAPIQLDRIGLTIRDVTYPVTKPLTYDISAAVKGQNSPGTLTGQGRTDLTSSETKAKIDLKNMDLVLLGPYIQKKGDPGIVGGTLDLSMAIGVRGKQVTGPGTMVLRALKFKEGKGVADTFMGVPRSMVMGLLKSGNDEIKLDFALEGNLDDPKFSLRESLATRLAAGLATRLGLPVVQAGESVVTGGSKIIKETTKTIKGFFGGRK